MQAETWALVGHEFNMNSPKQLQEILFVERKLSTGKKTKTGFSTDISVLEELAREDPVPERILRHRTLQKLKSTYVDALLELAAVDPRIRTHYVQTGTATGRLSSRDPNLQNIPVREEEGRRIRKAFVAAPGKMLISADYSQIELVVFAHLSGDPELSKAFLDGADVHRRTAALILGKEEDDVIAGRAPGRQDHQFRRHLRHGRLPPGAGAGHSAERGAEIHRRLLRSATPAWPPSSGTPWKPRGVTAT